MGTLASSVFLRNLDRLRSTESLEEISVGRMLELHNSLDVLEQRLREEGFWTRVKRGIYDDWMNATLIDRVLKKTHS